MVALDYNKCTQHRSCFGHVSSALCCVAHTSWQLQVLWRSTRHHVMLLAPTCPLPGRVTNSPLQVYATPQTRVTLVTTEDKVASKGVLAQSPAAGLPQIFINENTPFFVATMKVRSLAALSRAV